MPKHVTTIRLDEALRKKVLIRAKKMGLSLSEVVHLLLKSYADKEVSIGVVQYPKKYMDMIHKELDEMHRLRRAGKLKSYASGKEMMDDILKE